MKILKERILKDGKCFEGGILKVDNFINHQMDPALMHQMAQELVKRFSDHKINKVLTVEASGMSTIRLQMKCPKLLLAGSC